MTTQVSTVAFLPMYVVRGTRDHAETLRTLRGSGMTPQALREELGFD